jgi:hypothetical protein
MKRGIPVGAAPRTAADGCSAAGRSAFPLGSLDSAACIPFPPSGYGKGWLVEAVVTAYVGLDPDKSSCTLMDAFPTPGQSIHRVVDTQDEADAF